MKVQLHNIQALIKNIPAGQKNSAKKLIAAFFQLKTISAESVADFFDLVDTKPDEVELWLTLNVEEEHTAQFLNRFYVLLQESLIADDRLSKGSAFNILYSTKFRLWKEIMIIQHFYHFGLVKEANKKIEKCIATAVSFELYDELVQLYSLKYKVNLTGFSLEKLDIVAEQLDKYTTLSIILSKVQLLYNQYVSKEAKLANVPIEDLKKVHSSIKYYSRKTKSLNIKNYELLTLSFIKFHEKNILGHMKIIKKLIDLIEGSHFLFSKYKLALLHGNLSEGNFKLLNFSKSLLNVQQALRFNSNKRLEATLYNIKVSILILMKNLKEEKKIEQTIKSNELNNFPFEKERLLYSFNIIKILKGEHEIAFRQLNALKEMQEDKAGYNLWIRVYKVICLIELKEYALLDKEKESTRKYISRTSKHHIIGERPRLILSVLMELHKQRYDFKQTAELKNRELEKLAAAGESYSWNPGSPELILFHEWFEAKRLKKVYCPDFEVYRKKK